MTTCSFSQGYTDFDGSSQFADCRSDATWLVWFPPTGQQYESEHGTVVPLCGDHLTVAEVESPDAERVQISTLPMTCESCGDPVWATHAHDHATGQACDFCQTRADHPACSCPVEADYLRAMVESEMADHQ